MSQVPYLGPIIVAAGTLVAVALVAVAVLRLKKISDALKMRIDAYADLPITAYVDRVTTKIERASQGIARAPGLLYRARSAQRDVANAFAKISHVLATPASLWRLGEVLVTGKTRS